MSSLVAYDDSDPEDESESLEEDEKMIHRQTSRGSGDVIKPDPEVVDGGQLGQSRTQSDLWTETYISTTSPVSSKSVEDSSNLRPPRPQTVQVDKKRHYGSVGPSEPSRITDSRLGPSGIVESTALPPPYLLPLSSLPPLPPQRPLGPAVKKLRPLPAGIRPYVSKRHKPDASGTGDGSERYPGEVAFAEAPDRSRLAGEGPHAPGPPPRPQAPPDSTRLRLWEVSERVRPYLGHRAGKAQVPRRVHLSLQAHQGPVNTVQWNPVLSLQAHQGPVNTVQWNPVLTLSHLLLSASMDRTVKVWDGAESGRCLRVYSAHSGAVRDAHWLPCGRRLLTGSFDSTAMVTDVETGQQVVTVATGFRVMCVAVHPGTPELFLCGGFSPEVKAWDARTGKVECVYRSGVQQTLALLFLSAGSEFISSSDVVSRDSAERTLMAWDYRTTARLSNQIYHERFTCPSLARHPDDDAFVAQSNGDYVAAFSAQRPYRMNKRRRYEGHKVEGYAVRCAFSPDGTLLATGSSTGHAHFYDFQSGRALRTLPAHGAPCLGVAVHPALPATAATCDWGGEVRVWN